MRRSIRRAWIHRLVLASAIASASGCAQSHLEEIPHEEVPPTIEPESESDSHDIEWENPATLSWNATGAYDEGLVQGHTIELVVQATEHLEVDLQVYSRVSGSLSILEMGHHSLSPDDESIIPIDLRATSISPASLTSPAQVYVRALVIDSKGNNLGYTETPYLFAVPTDDTTWQLTSLTGLRADLGLPSDDPTPVLVGEGRMLPDVLIGDPAQDGPLTSPDFIPAVLDDATGDSLRGAQLEGDV